MEDNNQEDRFKRALDWNSRVEKAIKEGRTRVIRQWPALPSPPPREEIVTYVDSEEFSFSEQYNVEDVLDILAKMRENEVTHFGFERATDWDGDVSGFRLIGRHVREETDEEYEARIWQQQEDKKRKQEESDDREWREYDRLRAKYQAKG